MSIEHFLDEDKKIKSWPAKQERKKEILLYLAEKFNKDVIYTEKDVNNIIKEWHTFGDFFLLRRGLIDYHFLVRAKDGSRYWKDEDSCEEARQDAL